MLSSAILSASRILSSSSLFDLLRLVKRVERLALIKVTAPLIRFHINWLRVGCVDDRIGMNFCDVVSDDFKWHGDHLLSWDL